MRKFLFTVFVLLTTTIIFTQATEQQDMIAVENIQHSVFLEFLGNTSPLPCNITYDCSFRIAKKHKIALGLGISYFNGTFISPQINYLYGKKHHLELGVGTNLGLWTDTWRVLNFMPTRIGYRYQRNNGGFFWKIAFVPHFAIRETEISPIIPSAGVAFGYTFKNKK